MSGGIAYVFDEKGDFSRRCNQEMVSLTGLSDEAESEFVESLIFRHFELTGSQKADEILQAWDTILPLFVRVIPNDYRRVIEAQKIMLERGLSQAEAEMAAFAENAAVWTIQILDFGFERILIFGFWFLVFSFWSLVFGLS